MQLVNQIILLQVHLKRPKFWIRRSRVRTHHHKAQVLSKKKMKTEYKESIYLLEANIPRKKMFESEFFLQVITRPIKSIIMWAHKVIYLLPASLAQPSSYLLDFVLGLGIVLDLRTRVDLRLVIVTIPGNILYLGTRPGLVCEADHPAQVYMGLHPVYIRLYLTWLKLFGSLSFWLCDLPGHMANLTSRMMILSVITPAIIIIILITASSASLSESIIGKKRTLLYHGQWKQSDLNPSCDNFIYLAISYVFIMLCLRPSIPSSNFLFVLRIFLRFKAIFHGRLRPFKSLPISTFQSSIPVMLP